MNNAIMALPIHTRRFRKWLTKTARKASESTNVVFLGTIWLCQMRKPALCAEFDEKKSWRTGERIDSCEGLPLQNYRICPSAIAFYFMTDHSYGLPTSNLSMTILCIHNSVMLYPMTTSCIHKTVILYPMTIIHIHNLSYQSSSNKIIWRLQGLTTPFRILV